MRLLARSINALEPVSLDASRVALRRPFVCEVCRNHQRQKVSSPKQRRAAFTTSSRNSISLFKRRPKKERKEDLELASYFEKKATEVDDGPQYTPAYNDLDGQLEWIGSKRWMDIKDKANAGPTPAKVSVYIVFSTTKCLIFCSFPSKRKATTDAELSRHLQRALIEAYAPGDAAKIWGRKKTEDIRATKDFSATDTASEPPVDAQMISSLGLKHSDSSEKTPTLTKPAWEHISLSDPSTRFEVCPSFFFILRGAD